MTTEKYIIEERKKHKDRYILDKVEYKGANEKICLICPEHGEFWQLPYRHLEGQGCPKCSGRSLSRDDIIKKFTDVHGDKYRYEKVVFSKMKEKVCIICPEHGEFWQTPQKHISGQGCPVCGRIRSNGTNAQNSDKFISDAEKVHGGKYDYSKVEYDGNTSKVCIICPEHGEFMQRPNNHIQGCGCPKCANNNSRPEDEIAELVKPLDFIHGEKTILCGHEIDIFIPERNIGIEYDGLRWHSEQFGKDSGYHLWKTEECLKKGIRLIHIFEDEWMEKSEIVKSRIRNILGFTEKKFYARKCEIRSVESSEAGKFLDKNHIQGRCGSLYRYGLYFDDELVSLMTFGKQRKNLGKKSSEGKYELLRFCNKIDTTVVGGASRLMNYFIREIDPYEIISYADRRWSDGKLYEKLGFTLMHKTQPSYFYIIDGKRENRFKYRKDVLVRKGFDQSKSEHQIMLDRGIYRIYDCGCLAYKYICRNEH